jgi:hypothetical protein
MPMYKHDSGTADTAVTVPEGYSVKRYAVLAGVGGGTIIITPKGGSAQPTITVPAEQPWSDEFTTDTPDLDANVSLPAGSVIAFAGMATWVVRYT